MINSVRNQMHTPSQKSIHNSRNSYFIGHLTPDGSSKGIQLGSNGNNYSHPHTSNSSCPYSTNNPYYSKDSPTSSINNPQYIPIKSLNLTSTIPLKKLKSQQLNIRNQIIQSVSINQWLPIQRVYQYQLDYITHIETIPPFAYTQLFARLIEDRLSSNNSHNNDRLLHYNNNAHSSLPLHGYLTIDSQYRLVVYSDNQNTMQNQFKWSKVGVWYQVGHQLRGQLHKAKADYLTATIQPVTINLKLQTQLTNFISLPIDRNQQQEIFILNQELKINNQSLRINNQALRTNNQANNNNKQSISILIAFIGNQDGNEVVEVWRVGLSNQQQWQHLNNSYNLELQNQFTLQNAFKLVQTTINTNQRLIRDYNNSAVEGGIRINCSNNDSVQSQQQLTQHRNNNNSQQFNDHSVLAISYEPSATIFEESQSTYLSENSLNLVDNQNNGEMFVKENSPSTNQSHSDDYSSPFQFTWRAKTKDSQLCGSDSCDNRVQVHCQRGNQTQWRENINWNKEKESESEGTHKLEVNCHNKLVGNCQNCSIYLQIIQKQAQLLRSLQLNVQKLERQLEEHMIRDQQWKNKCTNQQTNTIATKKINSIGSQQGANGIQPVLILRNYKSKNDNVSRQSPSQSPPVETFLASPSQYYHLSPITPSLDESSIQEAKTQTKIRCQDELGNTINPIGGQNNYPLLLTDSPPIQNQVSQLSSAGPMIQSQLVGPQPVNPQLLSLGHSQNNKQLLEYKNPIERHPRTIFDRVMNQGLITVKNVPSKSYLPHNPNHLQQQLTRINRYGPIYNKPYVMNYHQEEKGRNSINISTIQNSPSLQNGQIDRSHDKNYQYPNQTNQNQKQPLNETSKLTEIQEQDDFKEPWDKWEIVE